MKKQTSMSIRWNCLAAFVAMIFCSSSIHAQLYWDSNGAVAGTAATPTGTWGTSTFWTTDALGGDGVAPVPGAWVSGSTAVFSAGTQAVNAYTVTVTGTQTAGGINVEEGTPTFNGGTISLNGSATINISSGRTNITGTTVIAGSAGLTKEGDGVLQFNAAHTYTGGTTNKAGTITLSTSGTFGAAASPLVMDGGSVRLAASRTLPAHPFEIKQDALFYGDAVSGVRFIVFSSTFTGTGGTIKVRHTGGDHVSLASLTGFSLRFRTGGIDINRPIILGEVGDLGMANLRMDHISGGDQIISGDISGPGVFERNNAGTVSNPGFRTILTGNNSYSGGTHLRGNWIGIGSDTALGTGTLLIGQDPVWVGLFAHGSGRTVTNAIKFDADPAASLASATNLMLTGSLPLTFTGPVTLPVNTINHSFARLTVSTGMVATFSGVIQPQLGAAVGIDKHGADTLILSGNNTYTGNTRVSAGTLLVNNTAGSGTGAGNVTVNSGAKFGGSGAVSGTVTLNSGATIAAGASVESLATGSETWAGTATNIVEINDATGGAGTGWDVINITGGLTITATSGNKFVLDVRSLTVSSPGSAANFNSASPYSWTIATTTTGITGFDADAFAIESTGFVNALNGGFFTVSTNNGGNDLVLNFNVAPAAPLILVDPVNVTVSAGGNAQFSVTATGDEPMTFRWKLNDVNLNDGGVISGATTATLTLTLVSQADAGNYTVGITNGAGSTNSPIATLTVIDPPVITTALTNQNVNVGENVTFFVAASGTSPFTYVWQKNGITISGETTDTLNFPSAVATNAGTYEVFVSNSAGTNSSTSILTVNAPPVITVEPASQTVYSGSNAVFSVTATGYPLNYQWAFNGAAIGGATDSSYTVTAATSADIGYYSVVITNGLGSDASVNATLSISQNLFADDFDTDSSANWLVVRNPGTDSLANAYFDYSTLGIPVAPNSVLTTRGFGFTVNQTDNVFQGVNASPIGQGFTGNYRLRFDMWLNFIGPMPGGGNGTTQLATAGVGAKGTNAQWAVTNPDALQFATSLDGESADDYRVYSNATHLAVASGVYAAGSRNNSANYYTTNFTAQTIPAAQTGLYPVTQNGACSPGVLAFKWRDVIIEKIGNTVTWKADGILLATVNTTATFSTNFFLGMFDSNPTSSTDADDHLNTAIFDNVRVQAVVVPIITAQPQPTIAAEGFGASFSVTASSSVPGLSYQWQKDGVSMAGKTDATLNLSNIPIEDDGTSYSVLVFNDSSVVTSDSAILTVIEADPPTVNVSPATQNINQGASASFTANTTGASLSYQWYHGATLLGGATTSTLTVNNVQPLDIVDGWTVVVTNVAGGVTSTPPAMVTLTLDLIAPKTTVTTPKPKAGTNVASVMLTGIAKDTGLGNSGIITSVRYGVNAGNVLTAPVTNLATVLPAIKPGQWPFTAGPIALTPGTNIMHVIAKDLAGNDSVELPFIFYYDLTNDLVLNIVGEGQVKMGALLWNNSGPITNIFKVGRPYKIDAFVGKGTNFVFTNWTTAPVNFEKATNGWVQKLQLAFLMQEEMTINANFMTNPFAPVVGTYNGLFSENAGVTHESAGFIQVKVKEKSTYSGFLLFDGDKITFSGKFTTGGTINREVSRSKVFGSKPPVQMALAIDLIGNEYISGTVAATNGDWTAQVEADKAVFTDLSPDTTNAGLYTIQIPQGVGAWATSPGGAGYGAISNSAGGIIKFGGMVADGQKLTQKVNISRDGNWPFYVPLYKDVNKAYQGSVQGWVKFAEGDFGPSTNNVLNWIKKDGVITTALYPDGFSNSVEMAGSPYVTPAFGATPIPISAGDLIIVSDGNLVAQTNEVLSVTATATGASKVTLMKTNTVGDINKATIVFKAKDGTFTGGFVVPPSTVKISTRGAVLQNTNSALGAFTNGAFSGTIRVE